MRAVRCVAFLAWYIIGFRFYFREIVYGHDMADYVVDFDLDYLWNCFIESDLFIGNSVLFDQNYFWDCFGFKK